MHKPPPQIPLNHEGPMDVIALGLPRCATSTAKLAFETILNVGPCMHMNRVLMAPPKMRLVELALREEDPKIRRGYLYKLFDGAAATADFPGHLFVEDLTVMYPNAKFILNIRKGGAASWSASMSESIAPFYSWRYRVACWWNPADWQHYQAEMAWEKFVQEKLGVPNFWCEELYEKHCQWVRDTCKKNNVDLLEWEPGMGWGELCAFLGKKVPEQGVPHINERGKMTKVLNWRIMQGLKLWAKKVGYPAAGVAVGGLLLRYSPAPALVENCISFLGKH